MLSSVRCATTRRAVKAYLIAGRPDTVYDFVRAWREAAGKKNWLIPLPLPTGMRIDCSAAEREIGFQNRSYVAGLSETFADDARFRGDRTLVAQNAVSS